MKSLSLTIWWIWAQRRRCPTKQPWQRPITKRHRWRNWHQTENEVELTVTQFSATTPTSAVSIPHSAAGWRGCRSTSAFPIPTAGSWKFSSEIFCLSINLAVSYFPLSAFILQTNEWAAMINLLITCSSLICPTLAALTASQLQQLRQPGSSSLICPNRRSRASAIAFTKTGRRPIFRLMSSKVLRLETPLKSYEIGFFFLLWKVDLITFLGWQKFSLAPESGVTTSLWTFVESERACECFSCPDISSLWSSFSRPVFLSSSFMHESLWETKVQNFIPSMLLS